MEAVFPRNHVDGLEDHLAADPLDAAVLHPLLNDANIGVSRRP